MTDAELERERDLDYWCEEFPDLTREEIAEICDIVEEFGPDYFEGELPDLSAGAG